ncbi:MAG TPA: Ig domain-containing protein [Casimicrobiaceae bacterium]|nr:Ig domain-containing protein [Casimicrobiaceae bacterium]
MPRSSGVAVRLARSAAGCMPAMLAALLLAPSPAGAITAIQVGGPLIAQVGRPFVSSFIPVNSHLPKYAVDWSLSPRDCLVGSGIRLDPTTGTLSGTPSTPGTFPCVITAVDTYPTPLTTAQRSFTLLVEPACFEPAITSAAPPHGTAGAPYAFVVSATGNPVPVLSVEGLPGGLSFDAPSGLISGAPEAAGTSTLTVTADNGCNAAAVQTYTLVIDRAATALSLVAVPQVAVFEQPVSVTLVASGGPPSPQGTVQLCVRGTGMFCGPPFDTVPPGTPPEKIAAPLSRSLDPNGRVDFRLTGLTIDAFTLSALYAGDGSHLPASAGPVDELVIKGVLLPAPPGGRVTAQASTSEANSIPALSSIGLALLSVAVAALAMAALRRRTRR